MPVALVAVLARSALGDFVESVSTAPEVRLQDLSEELWKRKLQEVREREARKGALCGLMCVCRAGEP